MITLEKNVNDNINTPLVVSDDMKSDLLSIACWVKFLNIVGAVGLVLIILGGFVYLTIPKFGEGLFLIIVAGILCLPLLRSFEFVRQARQAIEFDDNDSLRNMFGSVRYIVKFYGIYTIVVLGLYVVMLFLIAVAAAI